MKRTFVFLLLGPMLVAVTPWLIAVAGGRRIKGGFDEFCAMVLFLFTLLIAASTLPMDQYLAHALPLALRAPLIAIAGATMAVGLVLAVAWTVSPQWAKQPEWIARPFAIGGALCMGACSVLASG
jgi:hypothetical protein